MKKLSIVIVNYNVCHFLEQALTSVKKAMNGIDGEVWIVDNNSVDGSVEMLREKFPWVRIIENSQNAGFSKANNQAIRECEGEYVLLLNPDTVVEEDTFKKCIEFMDAHPEGGALGVKMLDGRGKFLPESKRGLPTPMVAFYKIFGLARLFPRSRRFGKYHLGYLSHEETNEIEVLSGAYMFIRKKALEEVGLLDEDYFMYGEDIDLSYRIIKGGYKNYYLPDTRIIHYKGESTKKTSINYVFIFYNAMIIFARKHFSSKNAYVFSFLINMAIYVRAAMSIGMRLIKRSLVPMADALVMFGGMYLLKMSWEQYYHHSPGYYPWQFMGVAVPVYIAIWIMSGYYNGAYDPGARVWGLIRGAFIGTILIAAISNFFDEYRFSKALIPLGTGVAIAAMLINRLAIHWFQHRNFLLGANKSKRIVIIGEEKESIRVNGLINGLKRQLEVVGYVSPTTARSGSKKFLGSLQQIDEIVELYHIDEVIFCSRDIAAHRIIEWMQRISHLELEFKIVPDDSDYVIGSNSKDKQGELYTVNIDMNINRKHHVRNKRVLDVLTSICFLLGSPALVWFVQHPFRFLENIFKVLVGKYTWVGYTKDHITSNLPNIRKGVIHPLLNDEQAAKMSPGAIYNRNFLYARDYHPFLDIKLIIKSFRYLGA